MTVREITKIVIADGWYFVRCRGSHKQYKHPTKKGIVTIPQHKGDLKPKTVDSILKQAGLKYPPLYCRFLAIFNKGVVIMKLIYPACFYPDDTEEDFYTVVFPDLTGAVTEGKTLAGAVEMAVDCGCGWLLSAIEDGEKIPKPTPLNHVVADEYENGFVNFVVLDLDQYQEKHGEKAIRKNCTIPAWLNTMAERQGVNFSQTLQKALKQELGVE